MCIGSSLSIPFIIAKWICAEGMDDVTAELLSLTMVMCGIATLLQTTVGVRLVGCDIRITVLSILDSCKLENF